MLILSRVCAEFYDKNRKRLHRITPKDLGCFCEVPEEIKQDPLFDMLVKDGSIKYPADDAKDNALEQDPFTGTTPDGKEIKPKTVSKAKTKNNAKARTQDPEPKDETGTKPEEMTAEETAETK